MSLRSALRVAVVVALVVPACGEPPPDVALPPRDGGHVADLAGIVGPDLEQQLAAIQGVDVVALTYETEQANCGEAFRAGVTILEVWDADVALVAVARPGDFASTAEDRERCLGLQARDAYDVPRSLREEISEQLVPPLAADNDWPEAFRVAAGRLAAELGRP